MMKGPTQNFYLLWNMCSRQVKRLHFQEMWTWTCDVFHDSFLLLLLLLLLSAVPVRGRDSGFSVAVSQASNAYWINVKQRLLLEHRVCLVWPIYIQLHALPFSPGCGTCNTYLHRSCASTICWDTNCCTCTRHVHIHSVVNVTYVSSGHVHVLSARIQIVVHIVAIHSPCRKYAANWVAIVSLMLTPSCG